MTTTDARKVTIESITIQHYMDTDPDLSHLGRYSDEPGPDCIDRQARGDMGRNEFRYFIPGNTAEETGSPDSPQHDYERMETYNRGHWYMLGIRARAVIRIPMGSDAIVHVIESPGIWGVESDGGEEYQYEIEADQLHELKTMLEALGIDTGDFPTRPEPLEHHQAA
jgi:hypothetical protein